MLKAVALALPVYFMGCFKLPKTTIENFTSAMAEFWWSSVEHQRKIQWMSWDKMCIPKKLGGLGFKDIESFNQALLAKQAWKLLQEPECLLARLLKSRYYENGSILEAEMGTRPSYGWRSVLHGRELLRSGLWREVGNGRSLRVWIDPWCDFGGRFNPLMKKTLINLELKVSDLLDFESGSWNEQMLADQFFDEDADMIKKLKPLTEQEDYWCWKHEKSGSYSVKSG